MSKRGDVELLCDIQEAVQKILFYSKNMSDEQFLKDPRTQDAVVRNFQVIGEAAKNISVKLKGKYKNIEWKEMARIKSYFSCKNLEGTRCFLDLIFRSLIASWPSCSRSSMIFT